MTIPLRIARPGGATTNYYYYELDLAGNVRGLRASGGASLGGYRYSAFGQTVEDTSMITQPLRWKGRWFSPVANGMYDVRARQWSPELGVFLSIDEFDFHESKTTLWGWPSQNPVHWRDVQGRGGAFETEPQCKARCDREHDKRVVDCQNENKGNPHAFMECDILPLKRWQICREGCISVCGGN